MGEPPVERPILLSGPLVRATLEGRKTVTRRLFKRSGRASGLGQHPDRARLLSMDPVHGVATFGDSIPDDPCPLMLPCQYGAEGDQLWVREAHAIMEACHWPDLPHRYEPVETLGHPARCAFYRAGFDRTKPHRWRPSIHMPRWASRLSLEITDVRPERLQSITTAEIRAEGVDDGYTNPTMGKRHDAGMRMAFQTLWDKLNAKRGPEEDPGRFRWERNPWVWRVGYRVLDVAHG